MSIFSVKIVEAPISLRKIKELLQTGPIYIKFVTEDSIDLIRIITVYEDQAVGDWAVHYCYGGSYGTFAVPNDDFLVFTEWPLPEPEQ